MNNWECLLSEPWSFASHTKWRSWKVIEGGSPPFMKCLSCWDFLFFFVDLVASPTGTSFFGFKIQTCSSLVAGTKKVRAHKKIHTPFFTRLLLFFFFFFLFGLQRRRTIAVKNTKICRLIHGFVVWYMWRWKEENFMWFRLWLMSTE
jgi:hypothetical protein